MGEYGFFLIFGVFVVLIIAGAIYSAKQAEKRRQEMFLLAQRLGLEFHPESLNKVETYSFLGFNFNANKDALVEGLDDWFELFQRGDRQYSGPSMIGRRGEIDWYLFDYKYEDDTTDSEGRRRTSTYWFSVVVARVPLHLPGLKLSPENWFNKIGTVFGIREMTVESEAFNKAYFIRATDERKAMDLLHPLALERMQTMPVRNWDMVGPYLMVYQSGRTDVPGYERMMRDIESFLELVPEYFKEDHGVDLGYRRPTDGL